MQERSEHFLIFFYFFYYTVELPFLILFYILFYWFHNLYCIINHVTFVLVFYMQIRGAWHLFTPSSELDSGAVTCSSHRILQIKDGGVHENVESIPSSVQKHQHSFLRRSGHDQSRIKRVIPAGSAQRQPLHPHPALVFQHFQQKVITQRENHSISGDWQVESRHRGLREPRQRLSEEVSLREQGQRVFWRGRSGEQRWSSRWVRGGWRFVLSSSDDRAHPDARARGLPERASHRCQQESRVSKIHQNHWGDLTWPPPHMTQSVLLN